MFILSNWCYRSVIAKNPYFIPPYRYALLVFSCIPSTHRNQYNFKGRIAWELVKWAVAQRKVNRDLVIKLVRKLFLFYFVLGIKPVLPPFSPLNKTQISDQDYRSKWLIFLFRLVSKNVTSVQALELLAGRIHTLSHTRIRIPKVGWYHIMNGIH